MLDTVIFIQQPMSSGSNTVHLNRISLFKLLFKSFKQFTNQYGFIWLLPISLGLAHALPFISPTPYNHSHSNHQLRVNVHHVFFHATHSLLPLFIIFLPATKAQVPMWLVHIHFAFVGPLPLPFSLLISLKPLPASTFLFLVFPSLLPLRF